MERGRRNEVEVDPPCGTEVWSLVRDNRTKGVDTDIGMTSGDREEGGGEIWELKGHTCTRWKTMKPVK